ncbi:MAG: 3-deoxy-D-manno-octulosonic acid transferase [Pseudomonadota bacterium]
MTPLLTRAYIAGGRFAEGTARRMLTRRVAKGKEDPDRIEERLGHASAPRPEGPLVWFHAASVGESVSLLELIRRLLDDLPGHSFLVTTGTVTSAEIMASRLPPGTIHQYAPLDIDPAVNRFLDHWRPDIAIRTESEFWPCLLHRLSLRGIPTHLINARLSERSVTRWRWAPQMARAMIRVFDGILAQDDQTAHHLHALGADRDRIAVTGTLKEGAAPLPVDEDARRWFVERYEARQPWCAASTHPGEEEIAVKAHRIVRRHLPGTTLILVPRHPDRGPDLADLFAAEGCHTACRSRGEAPGPDTDIYVADTLGELGLWYRLSAVSLVGGSLVPIGGHNPYEPAVLGSAILHGPHVENFRDAYARLHSAGAAVEVRDAESLAKALIDCMRPERAAAMATAGWDICSAGAETTDRVVGYLLPKIKDATG